MKLTKNTQVFVRKEDESEWYFDNMREAANIFLNDNGHRMDFNIDGVCFQLYRQEVPENVVAENSRIGLETINQGVTLRFPHPNQKNA